MHVFKTDKDKFRTNELKSWLWTFAFAGLIYFAWKYFFSFTNDNLIVGVSVVLLLKLGDTLTQYHVREIKIDEDQRLITVLLNSRMSGEKIKIYELEHVTSELKIKSGLTKYLFSSYILKIYLNPKNTFVISNRYGFSLETLTSLDKVLKSLISKP